MNIAEQMKKFIAYLLGKRSELSELGLTDIVMAKAILDIHRKRTHKELVKVPLYALTPIHPLDRDNVLEATAQRAKMLQEHREEILAPREITCEVLSKYLPSVSWIKVVQETPESYLTFEGNGRLGAMHNVFAPTDDMVVEVEQYHFRSPQKIVRRLNRVRRLNGLIQ